MGGRTGNHCACYGPSQEEKVEDKGGRGEYERGADRGTTLLALGHRRRKEPRMRERERKGRKVGVDERAKCEQFCVCLYTKYSSVV